MLEIFQQLSGHNIIIIGDYYYEKLYKFKGKQNKRTLVFKGYTYIKWL